MPDISMDFFGFDESDAGGAFDMGAADLFTETCVAFCCLSCSLLS